MKKREKWIKVISAMICCLLFFNINAMAQDVHVSGKVTDSGNEPLPGVTVMIKGTATGGITNMDGIYNIKVAKGQTLVFSFIGMKDGEVLVGDNATIDIMMEELVTDLQEVQVVAYGTQKKVTITGAISSVDSEELLKSPNASVANSLAGKVTGLSTVQVSGQPGADKPDIYIRGMGTFNDASPMYIVDGVERDFMDLDPNEIADITVLKDASATAVYGIRGANGVIIVTTKRGTEGKASISASVSMGMQQPTRLLDFTDSYTYAMRYNEAQQNDGANPEDLYFKPHMLEAFRTGSDPLIYANTDWLDYIMKNQAYQRQGNVSVRGGSKKVKYFVSVGVFNQDGLFETFDAGYDYNFSFNRYNYRSNVDIDVTKSTKIGITIGGRVGVVNQPNTEDGMDNLFRNINWSVPFAGPGIVDGKWIVANDVYIPDNKKEGLKPFYGRGYQNKLNSTLNMDIDLRQDLSQFVKGLKFRAKFAYNTEYVHTKTRNTSIASYSPYYQAHLDPESELYAQYDVVPEDKTVVLRRNGENGSLSYGEGKSKGRDFYTEFGFNYDRKFGAHEIGGLLLYNQQKKYYPTTSNGQDLDYNYIPTGIVGIVGRATYNYDTKYMAEFNLGYNGSENFAPEKRFGWFPAGSVGWVITQEPFMANVGVLNYLKIRGSFGLVGNDQAGTDRFIYIQGPYDLSSGGYNFGVDNPNNQTIAAELSLGNPDVTWEKAFKRNIGIDSYFFNDKLAVNVDMFWENRDDILMVRNTIPDLMAYDLVPVNIGEMENKGYEVEFKWKDKIGEFEYWINTNMSHARNKVTYMDEVRQPEEYMQQTGHPHNTPFGYLFDGFFTQAEIDAGGFPDYGFDVKPGDMKYKDLNDDGFVNVNDQTAIGYSRVPEYVFGSNLGFKVKGFDFSMSWSAATNVTRMLGDVYRIAFGNTSNRALLQYMADGRWTPETAETATYPRLTITGRDHNAKNSDFWLKDASYIRLKNVEVGYNFGGGFLTKLGMKNLRAYVNGSNLLTFDKIKIADPESNTAADAKYPIVKIYNIGLKANF